jgi:protein-S-isoprenylcysteine O-methyltransferase Ste14
MTNNDQEGEKPMIPENVYRTAFLILLVGMLAMRGYFMLKVRQAGERLMPDQGAVEREGGGAVLALRIFVFLILVAFLVMYIIGLAWIDLFSFPLPAWLRWAGCALGLLSLAFWTWTQAALDTRWSAQLQLRKEHTLVTSGPYARIRHPLYAAMFAWAIALALLTANWIFVAITVLTIAGTAARVPKEEQMMLDSFGDEYRAYMHSTGRFFPKF